MSGIVKKINKKIIVNKSSRNINSGSEEIDLELYINDALSLGYEVDKEEFITSLEDLPLYDKLNVNVFLHPYIYKGGSLCGVNGDTKTVDFFKYTRESKATTFNIKGEIALVDKDTPRFYYNPKTTAFEGFLMEKASMNLYKNSLCTDGTLTQWDRGDLLKYGYDISDGSNKSIEVNFSDKKVYNFSFFIKLDSNPPTIGGNNSFDISLDIMEHVASYNYEELGLNLYRISFVICELNRKSITLRNNSGSEFTVTGFQIEEGNTCTSYIPTNDAVTYRLPDVIKSDRDIVVFNNNSIKIDDIYVELENLPYEDDFVKVDEYGKIILQSKNINKFKYLCFFDAIL